MNNRDYQRHISESCRRDKEERAEAQNKIAAEMQYLEMERHRDLLQMDVYRLEKEVAELKEWKAKRVYYFK